jgi:DNA primase
LDHLLASGLAVRVAVMPAPHDPDSLIKSSGAESFKKLLEEAEGFFDYYLNRLCATNDVTSDKGRLAVLLGMAQAVHKTSNVVLIDKYAQKTALRLGVSPESVRIEFKKLARTNRTTEGADEAPVEAAAELEPPSTLETWLLKILLLQEDLLDWATAHLDPDWVQHGLAREIITRRLAAHSDNTWKSLAAFLGDCESAELQNLITDVVAEERAIINPAQQLTDITVRLRNQYLDRQLAGLIQRANQPETNESDRLELLRQQQDLRSLKRQPLAPLTTPTKAYSPSQQPT